MRKGIKQTEVPVHVLVFDERAAHDDLWNQNQRDYIGRGVRVGKERRENETQRLAAHRRQEHYGQIDPEHAPDLQDEIADQHEKNTLDERKETERDRLGDYVVGQAHLNVALALQHWPIPDDVIGAVCQPEKHCDDQTEKQKRRDMISRSKIVRAGL